MTDATREEVISWCIDNTVDFNDPKFPPPKGWMWSDNGPREHKTLIAILTNTEDSNIDPIDILSKLCIKVPPC